MVDTLVTNLVAATVFAVLGIVIFALAFLLIDRFTPGNLWEELMRHNNTGLGVLMGGIAIGISVIIAAAIH